MPGRKPDHYARKAKREGMPARSIYKIEEIDRKWHVLESGDHVLDLGCAPGSWMVYAARRVGSKGRVVGVDLKPVQVALPAHAETRVGDIYDEMIPAFERFDVVLSDMAPATMGDHKTDALRSAALAERALQIAAAVLKPGGHVVVKVLEGGDVPEIVRSMRPDFTKVSQLRPKATRKRSTEIFLVGLDRKGAV